MSSFTHPTEPSIILDDSYIKHGPIDTGVLVGGTSSSFHPTGGSFVLPDGFEQVILSQDARSYLDAARLFREYPTLTPFLEDLNFAIKYASAKGCFAIKFISVSSTIWLVTSDSESDFLTIKRPGIGGKQDNILQPYIGKDKMGRSKWLDTDLLSIACTILSYRGYTIKPDTHTISWYPSNPN